MPHALETLRPTLEAIPADQVTRPSLPVHVEIYQVQRLLHYLAEHPDVAAALVKVGIDKDALDELRQVTEATREAQIDWDTRRARRRDGSVSAQLKTGYDLRAKVMRACVFNAGDDPQADEKLGRIRDGEGHDDMLADLLTQEAFLETHADLFARDETFDIKAARAELRATHDAIAPLLADETTEDEDERAKQLRDRAFMHLTDRIQRVRRAGRYVFDDDPVTAARFANTYQRQRNARYRGAQATTQDVPVPAQPEITTS